MFCEHRCCTACFRFSCVVQQLVCLLAGVDRKNEVKIEIWILEALFLEVVALDSLTYFQSPVQFFSQTLPFLLNFSRSLITTFKLIYS